MDCKSLSLMNLLKQQEGQFEGAEKNGLSSITRDDLWLHQVSREENAKDMIRYRKGDLQG